MKRVLQFLAMVGLLLVITFACQREENELLQEEKGISLQEAKQFFEQQETEKERNGIDFKIKPKWETFMQGKENKDSFVYVQAVINHQKERKAEIFFSKTKNGLKGTVIAEHYVNDNLVFLISDLEGNILSITHFGREKTSASQSGRIPFWMCREGEGPCLNCYKCMELEPVPGVPGALRYPLTDPAGLCLICRLRNINLSPVDVYGTKPKSGWNDPWNDPRIPPMRDFDEIEKRFEEQRRYYGYGRVNGGGGGYVPPVKPKQVIDKFTDPCAKKILSQMRSTTGMKNFLKEAELHYNRHNFSEMIIDLFEKSSQTHLTFQNSSNTNNANGTTSGTTITLNNNYLRTATSLAIARTMIHEMVHAYLNATHRNYPNFQNQSLWQLLDNYYQTNKSKYANDPNILNRLHHEFMGQYVDAMAVSLQQWDIRYGTGSDLGFEYYKAQSYGGLFQTDVNGTITTETDSFKQLVPNAKDRQDIANKILNEQNNNGNAKGTKCR
ncbi:MAG: hypothetical protein Q4A09_03555 [Capnocytophaga felis]|nr:hypothetical protein [Capnocytophaga felis]